MPQHDYERAECTKACTHTHTPCLSLPLRAQVPDAEVAPRGGQAPLCDSDVLYSGFPPALHN
eukprot:14859255-Alexandrium_andersonii.AAC.1